MKLSINGFELDAVYSDDAMHRCINPLLDAICGVCRERGMCVAFIAGVPGAGKSTLAAALCRMLEERGLKALNASIDGFHWPNDYLRAHRAADGRTLMDIKGAPETYDVESLRRSLGLIGREDCRWPIYDRRLHAPVEAKLSAGADAYIIEGNWLMLRGHGWDIPAGAADVRAFIDAPDEVLLKRLIARKLRGGMDEKTAAEFCARSDMANVRLCREETNYSGALLLKL